jgi:hypothetical protein
VGNLGIIQIFRTMNLADISVSANWEIYEQLYNSADDGADLLKVKLEAENKINVASLKHVELVTPEIGKEAAHKLKSGKSDPVYSLSFRIVSRMAPSQYLKICLQSFKAS